MPELPPGQLEAYDDEYCAVCGSLLEMESCWQCMGAGGFHNDGEDTCCCVDPYELHDMCEECEGNGEYLSCPNVMHHPRQEEPHA